MATATIELKCATCDATASDDWELNYGDPPILAEETIRDAAEANGRRAERVQGDFLIFCSDCAENGTADRMLAEYGWQREDDDDADAEDEIGGDDTDEGEGGGEGV